MDNLPPVGIPSRTARLPAHAPLLPVALGLMLGITVDAIWPIPAWLAITIFAAAATFAVSPRLRRGIFRNAAPSTSPSESLAEAGGHKAYAQSINGLMILLAAASLGVLRHDYAMRRWPTNHVARFVNSHYAPLARITGEVISPVTIDSDEIAAHRGPFPTEPRSRFLLDASAISTQPTPNDNTALAQQSPVSGRILVSVAAPALQIAPGQHVEIFGRLYPTRGPDNPGQYDWALRRKRDGIMVGLSCGNERCIRVIDRAATTWTRLTRSLRTSLRRMLIDEVAAADETATSLLDAMVLAQRGQVERSLDDAFIRTGTVHFLCASGLNVAWLAAFVWAICTLCGAHYRTTAALSLAAILAYGVVAEPNPPIMRAVLTGSMLFAAQLLRRPRSTWNWLAGATAILLLASPTDLFTSSFQFSFAIVAGMFLLTQPIIELIVGPRMIDIGNVEIAPDTTPAMSRSRDIIRRVLFAPIASIIAWLIGIPIAAYHFGRFTPWGWLNSLLMAPLAFLVMVAGVAKLVIAAVFPSLGALLDAPLAALTRCLAWEARALAAIPGCNIEVPPPAAIWIVAYYVVLLLLASGRGGRWVRRAAWLAVIPIAVGLFIPWKLSPRRADELRIWSLAVGDGSATVIELPNGRTLAYDFGTRGFFDPAASIIVPFLRTRGISHLDAVIVSHSDYDHYGAIASVARSCHTDRVITNSHFARFAPPDSAPRKFLDEVSRLHIPLDTIHAGDTLPDTGDVKVECLWPPDDADAIVQLPKDNDTSTVLRITWEGRTVLLPGDIADAAESLLLRRFPNQLKADVLDLPHHGSTTARALPHFIDAVAPSITIRSTGQPDAATSDKLWSALANRPYYSTAECGAICIVIREGEVRIETFRPATGRPMSTSEP